MENINNEVMEVLTNEVDKIKTSGNGLVNGLSTVACCGVIYTGCVLAHKYVVTPAYKATKKGLKKLFPKKKSQKELDNETLSAFENRNVEAKKNDER